MAPSMQLWQAFITSTTALYVLVAPVNNMLSPVFCYFQNRIYLTIAPELLLMMHTKDD